MVKRKIAECINLRVNVGNYQHIELTKYVEEEIEYSSDAERIIAEDNLRDDLVASIKRSLVAIPESLGKGQAEAIVVEEAITRAMPEWLENNPVPNIAMANKAKVMLDKSSSEQKDKKDRAEAALTAKPEVAGLEVDEEVAEPAEAVVEPVVEPVVESKAIEVDADDDIEGLFADDDADDDADDEKVEPVKTEEKTAPAKVEKAEPEKVEEKTVKVEEKTDSDGFDIFDDADGLFD